MRQAIIGFLVMVIGLSTTTPLIAEDEAVVFALFFYSPTCSHCHTVFNWFEESGILEEFGDQLILVPFDVTTPEGVTVFQVTRQAMNIESNGVPMMIIGDTILYGSKQIPDEMHRVVREGLENGGIDLPPIPGLQEVYDQRLAQTATQEASDTETTTEEAAVTGDDDTPTVEQRATSKEQVLEEWSMKEHLIKKTLGGH